MRVRSRFIVTALVIAGGCNAVPDVPQSQQAISLGTTDTADTEVVLVWRPDNQELCSGSLLTGNVVLTAAHCMTGIDTTKGNPIVYLGVGQGGPVGSYNPAGDPTLYGVPVTTWLVDPNFVDGCPNKGDLALLLLGEWQDGVKAAPLAAPGVTLPATGTQLPTVGYGVDETQHIGVRKRANETLEAVAATYLQVGAGIGAGGGFAQSGDSGSPLFSGSGVVIGTVMCHNTNDSVEYYQRVDQEAAFIANGLQTLKDDCNNTCKALRAGCAFSDHACQCRYYDCQINVCSNPVREPSPPCIF